jgi:hypothetical protein
MSARQNRVFPHDHKEVTTRNWSLAPHRRTYPGNTIFRGQNADQWWAAIVLAVVDMTAASFGSAGSLTCKGTIESRSIFDRYCFCGRGVALRSGDNREDAGDSQGNGDAESLHLGSNFTVDLRADFGAGYFN